MKKLLKFVAAAALAGGFAATAAAPAEAGVSVGIGVGVPVAPGPGYYHRHWCYNHPGACGRPGYVVAPAPVYADGVYIAGRGYWHAGHWWGHRAWIGGRWVFR